MGVSNPSGSRPNFFGRQHLTFDKGGKDMVLSEGLLSFCEGCGDGEAGGCKAIPPVVARIFSGDSTSPLTREARMLV